MRNLNLYTHYDKSLADVHRDLTNSKNAKRKSTGSKVIGKGLIITFLVVFAIAVPAGIYLGNSLSRSTKAAFVTSAPVKPDLRSTEEKLGYVKVQIFEFSDEIPEVQQEVKAEPAPTPVVKEEPIKEVKKEPAKIEQAKIEQEKIEPEKIIEKPIIAKKDVEPVVRAVVPTAEKKYSIMFEGIDPKEYDVVNALGVKFKISPNIVDSTSSTKHYWRVYRINPAGKTVIGGKNVELVKDFETKDEAVAYAKTNNIQSVIKLEELIEKTYTLRLCCSSLENAKKLAESSNIRNKTIKIIREK